MARFFVDLEPLPEPMRTSFVNPSEMYSNKFLFEIKIFAFTQTCLHDLDHIFSKTNGLPL